MWSSTGWSYLREETRDQKELRRYLQLEYGTSETAWFLKRVAAKRRREDGGSRAWLRKLLGLKDKGLTDSLQKLGCKVSHRGEGFESGSLPSEEGTRSARSKVTTIGPP